MNEEEKVVSKNQLEQDGEVTLFEGKPFSGVRIDYYENGKKSGEGHFKNGKEEGLHTEWYKNGQKSGEGHYKDGKEEGLHTEWYKKGQKSGEGQ